MFLKTLLICVSNNNINDVIVSSLITDNHTFVVNDSNSNPKYEIGLCGTVVTNCPLTKSDGSSDSSRGDTVACQLGNTNRSIGMSQFQELK